jgi:chromosomal replication initiator protein DnaA
LGGLPEFLRVVVKKGIVDESTAKRIELYRRSRGAGTSEFSPTLLLGPLDPALTFESLFRCKGNAFALDLAKTVASKAPGRLPYNPLYIYGDVGMGKTHLLSAIGNGATEKNVLMVNTADLEVEFLRAQETGNRAELRQWLSSAEILLMDDIQLCEGREDLQVELFSVLNHMTRNHRWAVISSDVPPTALAGVESRLLSRLSGGVIVGLQMADRNERAEFIRSVAEGRRVPQDVVDFLADQFSDNFRQLKAAVFQLAAVSDHTSSEITLAFARSVTGRTESPSAGQPAPEIGVIPEPPPEPDPGEYDSAMAGRFKEMLAVAESEEEQALALQIALGERIRQLRREEADSQAIKRLEYALELVREGKTEDAIHWISS